MKTSAPADDVGSGTDREDDVDLSFQAAADYVGAAVQDDPNRYSTDIKLRLYAMYKQATAGDCCEAKPSFFNFSARAKWDAWNQLRGLTGDEAKRRYCLTLARLNPDWQSERAQRSGTGGSWGPVFSSLAADGLEPESEVQTLHEIAGKGLVDEICHFLAAGMPVDERDDNNSTALHFAADRGQVEAAVQLLQSGADVNARDDIGQTPLHYAALCGHEQVCSVLLQHGADVSIEDEEGQTASALGPSSWGFWPA